MTEPSPTRRIVLQAGAGPALAGGSGRPAGGQPRRLPTLLAAAHTSADPLQHSDGIDLLPSLTADAPPSPRTLFWRYKANHQRAVRDGGWKVLKINENTFLFDVAADPMERANLRDRHRDVYDRLTRKWDASNAMLPEIPESFTASFSATQLEQNRFRLLA